MTRAQKRLFVNTLQAKRKELMREIGARRLRLTIERAPDQMDQLRCIADADVSVGYINRLSEELHCVEHALQEIHDGTFGICASCGRPIPLRRLGAVPWSPYCVACQERDESGPAGAVSRPIDEIYRLAS